MNFVPDYKGSSFNPEWLEKNEVTPGPERVELHTEYAELWNKVLIHESGPCSTKGLMARKQVFVIFCVPLVCPM